MVKIKCCLQDDMRRRNFFFAIFSYCELMTVLPRTFFLANLGTLVAWVTQRKTVWRGREREREGEGDGIIKGMRVEI